MVHVDLCISHLLQNCWMTGLILTGKYFIYLGWAWSHLLWSSIYLYWNLWNQYTKVTCDEHLLTTGQWHTVCKTQVTADNGRWYSNLMHTLVGSKMVCQFLDWYMAQRSSSSLVSDAAHAVVASLDWYRHQQAPLHAGCSDLYVMILISSHRSQLLFSVIAMPTTKCTENI